MKKFLSLLLAAVMTLALCACGSKPSGGSAEQPADALALLQTVWTSYAESDKFDVAGGDFDEQNATEGAPGRFGVQDGDQLDNELAFPAADAGKLTDAASLVHMMNANTFTAGAFHVTNTADVETVVSDLKENILSRHWMCGFPDKVIIATLGDYVIACFGADELVDTFSAKLAAAYTGVTVVCDEPIA